MATIAKLSRRRASRAKDDLEQIAMETIEVPLNETALGQTLAELNPVARFGVQICGIQRDGARILIPASTEMIIGGDTLLALGAHKNIQRFRDFFGAE